MRRTKKDRISRRKKYGRTLSRKLSGKQKKRSRERVKRMSRKKNNDLMTRKIKLNFDGKKFNGRGNWVSASSNQVYVSYKGPKNSGRIYARPQDYKGVKFDDENNKFSGVWRGEWWDEGKQTEKMMNKKFQIQFGNNKEYETLKNLFNKK